MKKKKKDCVKVNKQSKENNEKKKNRLLIGEPIRALLVSMLRKKEN